jgi:Ca2+-binding RTX toxin-like protein
LSQTPANNGLAGSDTDDLWRGNSSDDHYDAGYGNDNLHGGYDKDISHGSNDRDTAAEFQIALVGLTELSLTDLIL